jgi:hypothetical protein
MAMNEFGPGMSRRGRCAACGGPLNASDGERCGECRPQLSPKASAIGTVRRAVEDRIAALERETRALGMAIKRIEKRLKWRERLSSKQRPTSGKNC